MGVLPDLSNAGQAFIPSFQRLQQKLAEVFNQFSESETEIIIQYLYTISTAVTELIEELKSGGNQ